ncbi:VWA domain-containing protein [Spirochaeta thermophila]|uniref:VWFA domain-containing protein n=1 Tax=Winmispira thermophila (strain ATCC 49972 / DSM 6192 / RI 19.B1) TaxID=665571 RepID=E0RU73_WINT6|nr:VWA domain-containing protein [Spirochaeta thermophila]ADN02294.1 hypothetical protein STHERM_c13540 [Spirochaeta thermophila DSM 6192]
MGEAEGALDLVVLVVDASASMGWGERMRVAKGAALWLLERAYLLRCRVGVVAFRGVGAEVVLAPTVSRELGKVRLARMPVGDATPLPAGLMEAARMVEAERMRVPGLRATVVLISDAESNVPLRDGADSFSEAVGIVRTLVGKGVRVVCVDAGMGEGRVPELARKGGAEYHRLPHTPRALGAFVSSLVASGDTVYGGPE